MAQSDAVTITAKEPGPDLSTFAGRDTRAVDDGRVRSIGSGFNGPR